MFDTYRRRQRDNPRTLDIMQRSYLPGICRVLSLNVYIQDNRVF